jgi:hypothetical protein
MTALRITSLSINLTLGICASALSQIGENLQTCIKQYGPFTIPCDRDREKKTISDDWFDKNSSETSKLTAFYGTFSNQFAMFCFYQNKCQAIQINSKRNKEEPKESMLPEIVSILCPNKTFSDIKTDSFMRWIAGRTMESSNGDRATFKVNKTNTNGEVVYSYTVHITTKGYNERRRQEELDQPGRKEQILNKLDAEIKKNLKSPTNPQQNP